MILNGLSFSIIPVIGIMTKQGASQFSLTFAFLLCVTCVGLRFAIRALDRRLE